MRSDPRRRIDAGFGAWGRFVHRHRRATIALVLAVSAGLSSQLPRIQIDNSTDSFLHPDDPIRIDYDDFRRRFGRDALISIAVEAPDVFDASFLERLRDLHRELLREVPHVEDLISLVNARNTRGEGDELIVEDLLEEWPETPEAREALRARVLANPVFRDTLVTGDSGLTTLAIKLYAFDSGEEGLDALAGFEETDAGKPLPYLSEPEVSRAVRATREVIGRYDAPGFRVHLGGGPVMAERLNANMARDTQVFILLAILAISALLFLLFRRAMAVVLPLLVVVLSMLSTVGLMAIAGIPFSIATQILPAFLLAVGVCDGVHLLAIYYRRLERGDGREDAIAGTLAHSGLPVVMTSLTTAGGLASFAAADLAPVANLGIFAPIGVMCALAYSLTLLPALLAVAPVRVPEQRQGAGYDALDRGLQALGGFAARRPWSVVGVTAALLVISAVGATKLHYSHDPLRWFPEDEPLRVSTQVMDERLAGVNNIEVLVETGAENGLHDPATLDRVEAIHAYAASLAHENWHVSKTVSLVDIVKEVHQALNANDDRFYRIPRKRPLVAQELLLFENSGSDDLEDFVDPQFSVARVTLRVPWTDAIAYPELLRRLEIGLAEIFGNGTSVVTTGLLPMLARTFTALIHSMTRSYVIAVAVITPLMILLVGNLSWGLLSMIPNLTPVIVTLGVMGFAGMAIDGTTMLVGATVIGLAVDDTIHFMHNFRRYYREKPDAPAAIRRTLETTGRALLVTSLVLSAGFYTFTAASMKNMAAFGLLTANAILLAFVANVVLSSALMTLVTRRGARPERAPAGRGLDRGGAVSNFAATRSPKGERES